jgi:hypothetical protein
MDTQSSSQKGSVAIANILNSPPPAPRDSFDHRSANNRDSAYSSKHASGASFNTNGNILGGPAAPGYPSNYDKTSAAWNDAHSNSILSPTASNMSVASMVPPVGYGADPRAQDSRMSLEQQHRQQQQQHHHPHHHHQQPTSHGDDSGSLAPGRLQTESRRQSVDSRFNQQMDDMELGGSPYVSHNASTTSFGKQSLGVQRTSLAHRDSVSAHRISNGYQPNVNRTPDLGSKIRTAPAITGPATGVIARAAEPTKGQAWAFPELEGAQGGSRRSSMADSLASSQFTDSRLPPGQRRFNGGSEYERMSEDIKSMPPTFQNRQLAELLREEELGAGQGQQPYSRTPELRVSHKLAERKRRTEMKELFDQLRELMPQERGAKASKWEILTKAINEHQRLVETNSKLAHHLRAASNENESLRRELDRACAEIDRLRSDSASIHQHQQQQHYAQHHSQSHDQLPPLRNIESTPESMSGVQYDPPRHSTGSRFRQ